MAEHGNRASTSQSSKGPTFWNTYSSPFNPEIRPSIDVHLSESLFAHLPAYEEELDRASAWINLQKLWSLSWFGTECPTEPSRSSSYWQPSSRVSRADSGAGLLHAGSDAASVGGQYNDRSWRGKDRSSRGRSQRSSRDGGAQQQAANGAANQHPQPRVNSTAVNLRSTPVPANGRTSGDGMDNHMPAGGAAISMKQQTNQHGQEIQRQQNDTKDTNNSGGVGTWAGRQFRLLDTVHEGGNNHGGTHEGDPEAKSPTAAQPSAGTLVAQALKLHQQQLEEESRSGEDAQAEEAVEEAAWKWRFARRWHAEQTRPVEANGSEPHDQMEDALQYINAGGGAGWNMQVSSARTASMELGSKNGSLINSILLDVDDGSMSRQGSQPYGHALGEATKEVNALNRQAAKLVEQQLELERQAESRWRESASFAGGEDWIGNRLEAVEVDDWGGPFRFVVIKVMGRNGKQQIIVRGRNYSSEATLVEEASRSMAELAAKHGLPLETMQVMGGGLMEWSRDGERRLYLHSGYVSVSECRHHTTQPSEILNLAGVLSKQSLPLTTKLSVNGRPT